MLLRLRILWIAFASVTRPLPLCQRGAQTTSPATHRSGCHLLAGRI